MSSHQDWEVKVLKTNSQQATKKNKSTGAIVPKVENLVRKQPSQADGVSLHKLEDNETPDFKHSTVTQEFKTALMKARQQNKWSQKDLANKMNVKVSLIADYENGKAIPEPQVIQKLNSTLNVKLPRIPKHKPVPEE